MKLIEIEYLRPILFILLFFVHAFTIYTKSSWELPNGIEYVETYDWILRVSYSSMLELFTFISGYVYYYVSLRKSQSFKELLVSKFRRLILPSFFFSFLYYILLDNYSLNWKIGYDLLCGIGHLWYLPMLFICFLISYYIKDSKKFLFILFITLVVSIFSRCPNVFRISQVAYYYFYFYLGICVSKNRMNIHQYLKLRKINVLICIFFVLSLIILLPLNVRLSGVYTETWVGGYFLAALIKYINILYSTIGIFFWYLVSIRLTKHFPFVPFYIRQFNMLSMGVYLFHQFVLMYLYYHTNLSILCGSLLLPWIAILIAIPSSILLSYFFRKIKIGKILT